MGIKQVLAHPDLPGITAYVFDDGTVVVSDANGRESKAQPFSSEDFTALGWEPQDDAITQLSALAAELLLSAAKEHKEL